MSFFNSKLYKQKPQAWGPVSAVKASIFKNAERIGIDPGIISRFVITWNPGNQIDYANGAIGTTVGATFDKNRLNFDGNAYVSFSPPWAATDDPEYCTILVIASVPYAASTQHIFTWAKGTSPYNGYGLTVRPVSGSTLKLDTFWDTWGTNNSTFPTNAEIMLSTKTRKSVTGWVKTSVAGEPYRTIHSKNSTSLATAPTQNFFVGRYEGGAYIQNGGFVKLAAFLRTDVSDAQIAYLSDNPYALIQRVPTVFYSVPGGAVIPTFNPLFLNAAQPTRVIQ